MKSPRFFQLVLVAALASFATVGSSHAVTVIFSTGFDSPTYADGGLIGQDNWAITGTSVVNPIGVANVATNGTIPLTTNGQDVNHALDTSYTTGSIYFSVDITVSAAQATGDYFLHFGDAGTSNFYARTFIKSSGAGYVMAVGTSSGTPTYGTTVLPFNTMQTILVRYDFVSGATNDTGALFVNPTTADGSGDTPYVAATTVGIDAASISTIRLRQGTAANAPTLVLDNLVVSVPETSSGLLGALGLLGLLRRRRI